MNSYITGTLNVDLKNVFVCFGFHKNVFCYQRTGFGVWIFTNLKKKKKNEKTVALQKCIIKFTALEKFMWTCFHIIMNAFWKTLIFMKTHLRLESLLARNHGHQFLKKDGKDISIFIFNFWQPSVWKIFSKMLFLCFFFFFNMNFDYCHSKLNCRQGWRWEIWWRAFIT